MKKLFFILIAIAISTSQVALPLMVSAQTVDQNPATSAPSRQFASDGIFGCNQTGAAASSVGEFSASGTYVPVADSAVILNTGYLVYLACSLRPLVSALSQNATAATARKILLAYNTGNDGNPQFSQNINKENGTVADKQFIKDIKGGIFNTMNPAFKAQVQRAIVQSYVDETQHSNSVLTCPYVGDLSQLLSGAVFSWEGLTALQNPACNPMGARLLAGELENKRVANAVNNYQTELQWGQGTNPIKKVDENGDEMTVTPGIVVLGQANQALQSGFFKTEIANDLGQMVNALFAGIGAQAISTAEGLAGITKSSAGQSSYIDKVTGAASAGVRTAAINTAITILNSVITTETNYKASLDKIAHTLINTIKSLQDTERQCWVNIIQNACVASSIKVTNGVETCIQTTTSTTTPAVTLRIATSTAFSNAIVQAQISALAQSTATQITSAQAAIKAVNQLVAGVTNTTSLNAQSLAIQQLDQLTASQSFPKPRDVTAAAQQASAVDATMQSLLTQTVQNWQGMDSNGAQTLSWDNTINPGIGWCNYNSPATIAIWQGIWKQ